MGAYPANRNFCVVMIILVSLSTASRAIPAADPVATTNTIGMKLVEVPVGEFMMGAEEDRSDTLNASPTATRSGWTANFLVTRCELRSHLTWVSMKSRSGSF